MHMWNKTSSQLFFVAVSISDSLVFCKMENDFFFTAIIRMFLERSFSAKNVRHLHFELIFNMHFKTNKRRFAQKNQHYKCECTEGWMRRELHDTCKWLYSGTKTNRRSNNSNCSMKQRNMAFEVKLNECKETDVQTHQVNRLARSFTNRNEWPKWIWNESKKFKIPTLKWIATK